MKILVISRCPPYPLHFGDRLILWHLATQLKTRGLMLDLLALAQLESDWQEIEQYQQLTAQRRLDGRSLWSASITYGKYKRNCGHGSFLPSFSAHFLPFSALAVHVPFRLSFAAPNRSVLSL